MQRIEPGDPESRSADLLAANVEELKRLFPEAVTEGKVDFEVLRQLLGSAVDEAPEKYGLSWHGKKRARALALTPSAGTLRPAPGESVDWETTQNVFIEGDNLEVLKLLQKAYAGKVKLIYIDPPYNTGKDFVYPDDYRDSIRNYLEVTGQVEGGRRVSSNTEASGRFHTDWLNMMYPRLKLARELLSDDGVMFISIDDAEASQLRAMCDELFGGENFVATICHHSRASVSNDKVISENHNLIHLYARRLESVFAHRSRFGLEPNLDGFNLSDDRGEYKLVPVDGPGGAAKGNPHYTFEGVTGYWRFSEKTMREKWKAGIVVRTANGLQQKYYKSDAMESRKTDTTWWDDKYYTSTATERLGSLMGADVFDNPKPVELVRRMLRLWGREDDTMVMDFFAGSGTAGHAVYEQNALDGLRRRFVLVQLPEPLSKSEASQREAADFCERQGLRPVVSALTMERLRRAAKAARIQTTLREPDVGFRVFKLAESNIRAWEPQPENLGDALFSSVQNLREDRSELDLLFEVMLKFSIELGARIETRTIAGKEVRAVGGGVLMACLVPSIGTDDVEPLAAGIAAWHRELDPAAPEKTDIVVRDAAFADDVAKTNFAAILTQAGIVADRIRSL